jgi:eukaryotic-like serine/threonine-protein kinase
VTPERYSQVKSLFQLVLQQPPETRHPFLEKACGADRELFSRVSELLHADSSSQDFLEKPAVTPISQILAEQAKLQDAPMPTEIGPYAISRQIGSGGMGSVYLASRADQSYNREVAIKVIRRGMETAFAGSARSSHRSITRTLHGCWTAERLPTAGRTS